MSRLISKFKLADADNCYSYLSEKDKHFLYFLMDIEILPFITDSWVNDCKRFIKLYEKEKR